MTIRLPSFPHIKKSYLAGGLLLWSILTAGFSSGAVLGQVDKIVMVVLLFRAVVMFRPKVQPRSLLLIVSTALYGLFWMLDCTFSVCGSSVEGTGTNVLRFVIYYLAFAVLRNNNAVRIAPQVVLFSLIFFVLGLFAQGDFSVLQSLGALGQDQFWNSYRFGIENETNNINYTAMVLATLVPFAFPRQPADLIGILALVCIAALVIATYSRSGLALYGVLLILSGISIWGLSVGRTIFLVALCIGAFMTIKSLGYFSFRSFDLINDASGAARLAVFDVLYKLQPFGQKQILSDYSQIGAIDNALVRHLVGSGSLSILILVPGIALAWQATRHLVQNLPENRAAIAALGWLMTVILDDQVFSLWGAFVLAWFGSRPTTNTTYLSALQTKEVVGKTVPAQASRSC